MGTVITFPSERCSVGTSIGKAMMAASVIILPVIRIERHNETSVGQISSRTRSSPRGKRRKR